MNLSIDELIENIVFLIQKDPRISRELAQAKEFFFDRENSYQQCWLSKSY